MVIEEVEWRLLYGRAQGDESLIEEAKTETGKFQ